MSDRALAGSQKIRENTSVQTSGLALQRACACGSSAGLDGQCKSCRGKRLIGGVSALVLDALRSPSLTLDAATRVSMENRFSGEANPLQPLLPQPIASNFVIQEPEGRYETMAEQTAERVMLTRGAAVPGKSLDFSGVKIHTDPRSAQSAQAIYALAYTHGQDIVFGKGQYAPHTPIGQMLLAHELAHVIQQQTLAPGNLQRFLIPGNVASEMVGALMEMKRDYTNENITVKAGDTLEVLDWLNQSDTATVQFLAPILNTQPSFEVPKQLLRPIDSRVAGMALYNAKVEETVHDIQRGEKTIAAEMSLVGGPRPGERKRLTGLVKNRKRELNIHLILQRMINRFDPIISKWTDFYNQKFSYQGDEALNPNLVKSMIFEESKMGTSGENLETYPSWFVRSRFNVGQVIDSSASALLLMMKERKPNLIKVYHLENIEKERVQAEIDLMKLGNLSTPTPAQKARLRYLRKVLRSAKESGFQFSEEFMWEFVPPGETLGFSDAVIDFYNHENPSPLSDQYAFWIHTAIRWLFEKRRFVKNWEEAVRAYNGSGLKAERYRNRILKRMQESAAAENSGEKYIPSFN